MHRRLAVFIVFALAGCNGGASSLPFGKPIANADVTPTLSSRHTTRRFAAGDSIESRTGDIALSAVSQQLPQLLPIIGRTLPKPFFGVTVDDVSNVSGIVSSLKQLKSPVTRVVFDRQMPATYYTGAIKQFDTAGYTMGELLDSSDIGSVSVAAVLNRTNQYLSTLGSSVDVWEIGNEVNGEWLGSSVPAKVHEMFKAVKAAGGKTAMTLYYEPPQTVTPGYDMLPWEENLSNVPADMHAGLDYVLVSYYETDNNGIRLTQAQWNAIFTRLAVDFPNAHIGFGEVGMNNPATASRRSCRP